MPFTPNYTKPVKLPTFQSKDKGLESALNLLARAIENNRMPDIRMLNGTMEWTDESLLLRPDPGSYPAGAAEVYIPWKPTFFAEGTGPTPIRKVRFNLGTVNNVPASNWNDAFTLGMEDDQFHFAILTITTSSGKVTGVKISIEGQAPTSDAVTKDVPPPSHKIVLGAIGLSSGKMIIAVNLDLVAAEVFREPVKAPTIGAEPITRWWRWTRYMDNTYL